MLQNKPSAKRPYSYRPNFETLEERSLPSVTPVIATIREATAAGPQVNAQAGIQATVDAFRLDLGNPVNGNAVGSQGAGRREITWDGGDNDAAPARLPADFFNAVAPRGAIFGGDPRLQFQVSADATPAVPGTLEEFGNVNATYPTAFSVFSSPRLFTALNNNVFEVSFFVPGTLQPASVSGFGAVFTDVDIAGSSKIEFFDVNGQKIFERDVLAMPGNESLSFLGVTFVGAPLARVRITAGEAALGPNDVTQTGGNPDIVVLDDFIYGEPQPLRNPRIAVGTDAGVPTRVQVIDGITGSVLANFNPYPGFNGGVRVAMGDVTGDGVDDIITAPGPGGGPHVKVFDGNTFAEVDSFFAFDPSITTGLNVAAGNVNGDANIDIIVSPSTGGGPHVKVVNGALANQLQPNGVIDDAALLGSFFAYDPAFLGGVTVAAGDINGDFLDDVITGTVFGAPHVKAINATQLNNVQANGVIADAAGLFSFFAYDIGFTGGVFVAAGDVNGDGRADIITGAGIGGGPHVKVFSGNDNSTLNDFFAFAPNFTGGVRVSSTNIDNNDRLANIVTATGPGIFATVMFEGAPLTQLERFFAFGGINEGVFVAASR